MEFIVDKDQIQTGLAFVSSAVATKSPTPIMEMIKLDVSKDVVTLKGTNSALYLETHVDPIEVISTGSVCVNRLCADFLQSYLPGEIHLKLGKTFSVSQGKTEDKFAIASPDEFPVKPGLTNWSRIDVEKFSKALSVCSIALSARADLPATQGFYVNPHLSLIFTSDGDQAVYYPGVEMVGNIVIPAGTYLLSLLPKLKSSEVVEASFSTGSWVGFRSENWEAYVSQKNGDFPDIIPKVKSLSESHPTVSVTVSVDEVRRLLSKSVRLSAEALNVGRFHHLAIDKKGAVVRFQMDARDIGSINSQLDFAECSGEDRFRILVHPKVLKEIFDAVDSDRLTFKFYSPKSPFLVVDPNNSFVYLQVPMKLDNEAEILARQQQEEEEEVEKEADKQKPLEALSEAESDF